MKKASVILIVLSIAASANAQTISIQPISQLTYCAGESGTVNYQSTGSFNSDNVFEVQLSDSGSDFSSWTIIGRATSPSGSIPVTFPAFGRYRVRIASTDPMLYSSDNGANIYISAIPVPNIYALASYGASVSIQTNQLEPEIIGVQNDSIPIFDLYDDSAVRHEWTFDQDASISSSTLSNPTVSWKTGGTKTGGVWTWNSEGCTDSANFSIDLESCDPVIPADAVIITGTESGDYQDVWVKPGGIYTGGAGAAFIEPGGEMDVENLGGWTVGKVYVKRGASLIIGSDENVYIADLDTAASFSNNGHASYLLHCDSLQFDYSIVQPDAVENSQLSSLTFRQLGDEIFASTDGLLITIRILNLLGVEMQSQQGSGSLDMDLSSLDAGIYFAVVQADGQQVARKIAILH